MSSRSREFLALCGVLLLAKPALAQFTTAVSHGVSDTGAGTFQIPIQVPPGIMGMAPKIALEYSSQSGNGVVGVGWALGGIPAMVRCPQTPATTATTRGIAWDSGDRFCLEGEYLVAIKDPANSAATVGTYGANGTFYSTEKEGFARIRSFTASGVVGPAYFVVKNKDGTTMEFGNSTDSRVFASGRTAVRVWALNRLTDAMGNAVVFSYTNDASTGQYYLSSIRYGWVANAHTASVDFSYESRTDVLTGYVAGSHVITDVRLSAITTRANAAAVMTYRLTYNEGNANDKTGNSLLTSVTQESAQGNRLMPVRMTWSAGAKTMTDLGAILSGKYAAFSSDAKSAYMRPIDLDGDGRQDLLLGPNSSAGEFYWLRSTGSGFEDKGAIISAPFFMEKKLCSTCVPFRVATSGEEVVFSGDVSQSVEAPVTSLGGVELIPYMPPASWVRVMDVDGDLRQDVVVGPDHEGDLRWLQATKTGGLVDRGEIRVGFSEWKDHPGRIHVTDFNGDGRSDLVFGPDGSGNWHGLRSNGAGFTAMGIIVRGYGAWDQSPDRIFSMDLDGDGQQDFVLGPDGNGCWYWLQGQPGGYADRGSVLCGAFGNWWTHASRIRPMDFNGDGRTDVVIGPDGSGTWYGLRSTGAGLVKLATPLASGVYGAWDGAASRIRVTDFNADGRADLLLGPNASGQFFGLRSTGSAFVNDGELVNSAYDTPYDHEGPQSRIQLLDLAGRGGADLIIGPDGSGNWFRVRSSASSEVVTVVDNLNGLNPIQYTYGYLTSSSVYVKGSDATYPLADVQLPMRVVSSVSLGPTSGPEGTLTPAKTTFTYGGLKVAFGSAARGLLGFRWSESTQAGTGLVMRTEFHQSFPFTGLPVRTEKFAADGKVLHRVDSTYHCNNFVEAATNASSCVVRPGQRYFVAAASVTDTGVDLNGEALPKTVTTNGYDGWGNLTTTTTATSHPSTLGAFTHATKNEYAHDVGKWWLNRLVRAEVKTTDEVGVSRTRRSSFDYHSTSGLMIKEIVEPTSVENCLVKQTSYDSYGHKTQVVERNCNGSVGGYGGAWATESAAPAVGSLAVFAPRTTKATYASDPRFQDSSENALGHKAFMTHSPAFGALIRAEDPNGLVSQSKLDDFGRVVLTVEPDGTGTKTNYLVCRAAGGSTSCPLVGPLQTAFAVVARPVAGPINLSAETTGAQNGPETTTYFDSEGRVVRTAVQGFDGAADAGSAMRNIFVDSRYNELDQLESQSEPYYEGDTSVSARFSYDAIGRLRRTTQPNGGTVETAYAGLSKTTTTRVTDADGRFGKATQVTTEVRDLVGRVVAIFDADGKTLLFDLDPLGNVLQVVDQAGNVFSSTYDVRGRRIESRDPDFGIQKYRYNALGELRRSEDAKGQVTTREYDLLGRNVFTEEPDASNTQYFEKDSKGIACGLGRLCESIGGELEVGRRVGRRFTYDALGRPLTSTLSIGPETSSPTTYTQTLEYDSHGRVLRMTYPSGLKVRNLYSTRGYLRQVRHDSNGTVYFSATEMTARSQVSRYVFGNGIVTSTQYDQGTGLPRSITAGTAAAPQSVHFSEYAYDYLGNIRTQRIKEPAFASALSLKYEYDNLSRLREESRTGGTEGTTARTIGWSYDAIGNVTRRSDLGDFVYPASGPTSVRPHAVSSIKAIGTTTTLMSFQYDANGNMQSGANRVITWRSFNMPSTAARNGITLAWLYDGSHERVRETQTSSAGTSTTTYFNPGGGAGLFYEDVRTGSGSRAQKNYITAGGLQVAVVERNQDGLWSTKYTHVDRLGSTLAVSDATGVVLERFAYEPFGRRRKVGGGTDSSGSLYAPPAAAPQVSRGFTGHEMLDELGLIHMNGRIYDGLLGRFLSPDPFVQSPLNMQSYNRYSYLLNNPLNGTDPSGYFLKRLWKKIWGSTVGRIAITVAAAWLAGAWAANVLKGAAWATTTTGALNTVGNVVVGAAGGFAGGFVGSGGHLKEGMRGAVDGAMFALAGTVGGDTSWARMGAHGAAGCASGAMNGDGCARGATAAFASKWVTIQTSGIPGVVARGAIVVVAGGAISKVTGGQFANGAMSAGFGYLFNECSREGLDTLFGKAVSHLNGLELFGELGLGLKKIETSWGIDGLGVELKLASATFEGTVPFGKVSVEPAFSLREGSLEGSLTLMASAGPASAGFKLTRQNAPAFEMEVARSMGVGGKAFGVGVVAGVRYNGPRIDCRPPPPSPFFGDAAVAP